jgi:hypothetical protein
MYIYIYIYTAVPFVPLVRLIGLQYDHASGGSKDPSGTLHSSFSLDSFVGCDWRCLAPAVHRGTPPLVRARR